MQIELIEDGLLVLAHDLERLEAPALGPPALGHAGDGVEHLDVERDHGLHAGAQHLDDDLATVGQLRGVHLRDRGGGERHLLERAQVACRAARRRRAR